MIGVEANGSKYFVRAFRGGDALSKSEPVPWSDSFAEPVCKALRTAVNVALKSFPKAQIGLDLEAELNRQHLTIVNGTSGRYTRRWRAEA